MKSYFSFHCDPLFMGCESKDEQEQKNIIPAAKTKTSLRIFFILKFIKHLIPGDLTPLPKI